MRWWPPWSSSHAGRRPAEAPPPCGGSSLVAIVVLRTLGLSAVRVLDDRDASSRRAIIVELAVLGVRATSASCAWLGAYVAVERLRRADRTYRARLRYAKLYAATTSSRRARDRRVPYLALRKVEQLKCWLALRAGRGYLTHFADERDADAVCATAFHACAALTLAVLALYFGDGNTGDDDDVVVSGDDAATTRGNSSSFPRRAAHLELLAAWLVLSSYVIAFAGLGSRINARYSNNTTLHVEMINVHLRLQRLNERLVASSRTATSERPAYCRTPPALRSWDDRPRRSPGSAAKSRDGGGGDDDDDDPARLNAKKAKLLSALAVLKLSTKLLKDIESPSRVSGFAMNPLLYNVARCIFFSALSAMLSEWIGLDLKFKPSYFK